MAITERPVVTAVHRDDQHRFSKRGVDEITLVAGRGVQGDAHAGVAVQHRSRVAADPTQPNLRQVHLMHSELFDELREQGFQVAPGQLGENLTTAGLSLLDLSAGTELHLGPDAVVQVTGLRNPCRQIDTFQRGVLAAVLGRDADGGLVRKAGIMSVVVSSGPVTAGDLIEVREPVGPHRPLEPV